MSFFSRAADRLAQYGRAQTRFETPSTDSKKGNVRQTGNESSVMINNPSGSRHATSSRPQPQAPYYRTSTSKPSSRHKPSWIKPHVSEPASSRDDPTWPKPPSDPSKGIVSLPPELIRQIILYLIYNPDERPGAFLKSGLLPFASTSKALRAVSTEFLFWSMDLFEASFGLRHRVLPSNTILQLFHDLINPPVPSFIRSGVRRLLIRDRDVTALCAPEGQENLVGILNRMENLRSIHFDGQFYRPLPMHALCGIAPGARLDETLTNLTFINCDPYSPLFPCFLTSNRWTNLARIEYWDKSCGRDEQANPDTPSPFACFESATEPVFPHLSTFVLAHGYQHPKRFHYILDFLKLHSASLDRLSVSTSGIGDYFDINVVETIYPQTGDDFSASDQSTYGVREMLQIECKRALWKFLPSLKRLRLLELDIAVTRARYAPNHMVRIPSLRALHLRDESARHLRQPQDGEKHPVTSFFNRIPSPSIAYSLGSPAVYAKKAAANRYRAESARGWFEISELPRARNFTHSDVMEGRETWISLDGGGVRDVRVADEEQKKIIAGQVGGWSLREDAELNHRFTSE